MMHMTSIIFACHILMIFQASHIIMRFLCWYEHERTTAPNGGALLKFQITNFNEIGDN